MRLKLNKEYAYGNFNETQIDLIIEEMKKPKHKRKYMCGIEFKNINEIEVIKTD